MLSISKVAISRKPLPYLLTFFVLVYLFGAVQYRVHAEEQTGETIEVLYLGNKDDMAFLGLGHGLEESAAIYDQLNLKLKIESENLRPFNDPKPRVIFAAMEGEAIRITSLLNPGALIINVLEDSADLRALCLRNVVHIMPSELMREAAISRWSTASEKKVIATDKEAKSWSTNYRKGTAGEMNDKFADRRSVILSEQGWAGWAAARIFFEAYDLFVRTGHSYNPSNFRTFLSDQSFEVHKSERVQFRSDGQMIQSLFITDENDSFISEVTYSDDLDHFGPSLCQ